MAFAYKALRARVSTFVVVRGVRDVHGTVSTMICRPRSLLMLLWMSATALRGDAGDVLDGQQDARWFGATCRPIPRSGVIASMSARSWLSRASGDLCLRSVPPAQLGDAGGFRPAFDCLLTGTLRSSCVTL